MTNPADIIPRLLAERQEILAAIFSGTHTEAQWLRLTEIRGQIDGIMGERKADERIEFRDEYAG